MSKAFTKDDGGDEPPIIPPRAALPEGVPNYVTARGLALLRSELTELEGERSRLLAERGDEGDRRHRLALLAGRLADLSARLAGAQVVEPQSGQPPDEVRFGATVTLRISSDDRPDEERRFQIVGVDEADPSRGKIAFVAPMARAVVGLRAGDSTSLRTGRGEEELEILAVEYTAD